MSRWSLLLVMLCALALGLAACGGDDAGDDDVATILSDTFGKGKEVKSGRLDVSIRLNAQGLPQLTGPVTVGLSGPFQSLGGEQLPKFAFEAKIDASGQQLKAGAVSTGQKGYVTFQDQPYVLSDELFKQFKDGYAEQAKCNEQRDSDNASFSALGVNPRSWLADAKKAGTEKVGGAETIRVTGAVDVPKFLEDINRILARTDPQSQSDPCADDAGKQEAQPKQGARTLTAAQRKAITDAVKDAKVEIWTGEEDRTMRRMNVAVKFDVPEGSRQAVGGLRSGDLKFDLTIGDLNEEQKIAEPKNAQPFEQLVAALQGGQAGGAGSGSGSGGTGGAQGSTGGSKYQECMAAAGEDVAKLQECAGLVGQ